MRKKISFSVLIAITVLLYPQCEATSQTRMNISYQFLNANWTSTDQFVKAQIHPLNSETKKQLSLNARIRLKFLMRPDLPGFNNDSKVFSENLSDTRFSVQLRGNRSKMFLIKNNRLQEIQNFHTSKMTGKGPYTVLFVTAKSHGSLNDGESNKIITKGFIVFSRNNSDPENFHYKHLGFSTNYFLGHAPIYLGSIPIDNKFNSLFMSGEILQEPKNEKIKEMMLERMRK
jgi:hypothetical protein